MLIEIRADNSSIVLGDDSRRFAIDKYLPAPEWEILKRPGVRSDNVKLFPRKNCMWTIPFEVQRFHDSEDEATQALVDFPLSIPLQGTLIVTQTRGIRYFLNATKKSIRPIRQIGANVTFSFLFWAEESALQMPQQT